MISQRTDLDSISVKDPVWLFSIEVTSLSLMRLPKCYIWCENSEALVFAHGRCYINELATPDSPKEWPRGIYLAGPQYSQIVVHEMIKNALLDI